ncbi:hypothetical protein [Streptomyces anulatus]|uniref:hypothetical protein n=2 Tax=Streptomyces anulatus TaxID=1892 RepID=UPI00365BF0AE
MATGDHEYTAFEPLVTALEEMGRAEEAQVMMLADHGYHDQALQLLEERSTGLLEESAHWVPSNRWWLMGASGRCCDAIAEIEATPELEPEERGPTLVWLLARDGRLDTKPSTCFAPAPESMPRSWPGC